MEAWREALLTPTSQGNGAVRNDMEPLFKPLYIYEDLSSIKEDSKHKPLKTDISTYKERSQFHTGTLINNGPVLYDFDITQTGILF
jgi:hypothetical protein